MRGPRLACLIDGDAIHQDHRILNLRYRTVRVLLFSWLYFSTRCGPTGVMGIDVLVASTPRVWCE